MVIRQRIDNARNKIVERALNGGFDYLLFLDDDNPVPPDTLTKLLEDDKDIVTAPILVRTPDSAGEHGLCAFYSKEYDGVRMYDSIKEFRDEGYLHRIDACGMGCTMIKRRVLEALRKKHGTPFEFGEIREVFQVEDKKFKARTMSEDMEFSERAVDTGFEIWLDDRIRPIHLGEEVYHQWEGANG